MPVRNPRPWRYLWKNYKLPTSGLEFSAWRSSSAPLVHILFVAITVLSLFAEQVLGVRVDYFSVPCFGLALIALLGSLYHFIRDLGVSLAGLELEIGAYINIRSSR